MKNILKITIATFLLASLTACDLDRYPDSGVPEDKAMTTPAEAQQVVLGVYSALKNGSLYTGGLTTLPDIQADLAYAIEGYSNAHGDIYRWIAKSNDPDFQGIYAGLYLIISRCNFFMDNIGKIEENYTSEADKTLIQKCKGDIHFLRALAYSELIRLYCNAYDPTTAENELGVSIVLTYAQSKKKPLRSNLQKSYDQVLEDLTQAEKLVKREGYSSPYVTKGVIQALFSRVYLYMQNWEKAKEYATELIKGSVYALQDVHYKSYDAEYNDYDYMWTYDQGREVIFYVPQSYTDRSGALGELFLGPAQYASAGILNPDYIPAQWALDLYESDDMRYYSFFSKMQTNYAHGLVWPLLVKYGGNPVVSNGGPNLLTNMPKIFRLAEIYLIRAEACYRLGGGANETIANSDLTTIRQARYQSYGSSAASGESLFKEIQKERVRELYMEGFRLSDLKRWGLGFTRKPQASTVDGPNRLSVDKNNPLFTWPIPKHELDAVAGMQPNASN